MAVELAGRVGPLDVVVHVALLDEHPGAAGEPARQVGHAVHLPAVLVQLGLQRGLVAALLAGQRALSVHVGDVLAKGALDPGHKEKFQFDWSEN